MTVDGRAGITFSLPDRRAIRGLRNFSTARATSAALLINPVILL